MPPRMFACRDHWRKLPKRIKDAIWREYAPGQERTKTPSLRYLAVQRLAVAHTAFRPHDEVAAAIVAAYVQQARYFANKAIAAGLGDPLVGLW